MDTKVHANGYFELTEGVGQLDGTPKCPKDKQCATPSPGKLSAILKNIKTMFNLNNFTTLGNKKATIEGTFNKNDVKIVFNVDGTMKSTYFSEDGTGWL